MVGGKEVPTPLLEVDVLLEFFVVAVVVGCSVGGGGGDSLLNESCTASCLRGKTRQTFQPNFCHTCHAYCHH